MAVGPGKYDDACTEAARAVGIDGTKGGGVILIVFGGDKGSGFSIQADLATSLKLPNMLRYMADQIERDVQ
jgi:hypothetical protein